MRLPAKPTAELINSHLQKWETLENYKLQEQSLALLFHQLCPRNSALEHVLLKVTALNQFYSTNIFDTYSVAKHILRMDIDHRLAARDLALVNELAMITIRGKPRNFYSFASKYCSHHVPEAFPIFDSFVEQMLLHYRAADNFEVFARSDLKNYSQFVRIVAAFQKHYALDSFSLRQIDVFLWLVGKDSFPRNYGKRKETIKVPATFVA